MHGLTRFSLSSICYLAKPQPKERPWDNQRGKKALLILTLVRPCQMTKERALWRYQNINTLKVILRVPSDLNSASQRVFVFIVFK